MLQICTKQEFEQYVDYVYEIAIDPTKSGYPSYSDGIKTKEMFIERSSKAFLRDDEEILLFKYEEKVEGWIHYYFIAEDNYLDTVSFNVSEHYEQALLEFEEYVKDRFKGYELFLGYSTKNIKAINYLSSHGYELIEENNNNTCYLDKYEQKNVDGTYIRIDRNNFDLFKVCHDNLEGDMYWDSDHIYDDLDNWVIFVKIENSNTLGCVYYKTANDGWYEIFGIDLKDNIFDKNNFSNLLEVALNNAKSMNGKYMTMFCDDTEEQSAISSGFTFVDKYVCYKKKI